jgi:Mg/Co/Ni transporter MgtE
MASPVVTLPDWLTVDEFLGSVAPRYRNTTYPLHDPSGRLTGVTRLRDLLRVPERERRERRLRDCARPIDAMPQAAPGDDLEGTLERIGPDALELRVLVFDRGQLVGILSPNDVARLVTLRQATAEGRRAA